MKTDYMEKIKEYGVGVYIMGVAIFFIILMIGWLVYSIFISSKG